MNICHGNGNLDTDGCCYVAGVPCPLRWKLVNGRIYEGPDLTDLGPVDAYVDSVVLNRPGRERAKALTRGVVYLCKAAVEILVAQPNLLDDRAGFEAAWDAHPDYVALVKPHWDRVERDNGLEPGAYRCSTWRGTSRPECCFAEDAQANEAKAAGLTATAVSVRRGGVG